MCSHDLRVQAKITYMYDEPPLAGAFEVAISYLHLYIYITFDRIASDSFALANTSTIFCATFVINLHEIHFFGLHSYNVYVEVIQ